MPFRNIFASPEEEATNDLMAATYHLVGCGEMVLSSVLQASRLKEFKVDGIAGAAKVLARSVARTEPIKSSWKSRLENLKSSPKHRQNELAQHIAKWHSNHEADAAVATGVDEVDLAEVDAVEVIAVVAAGEVGLQLSHGEKLGTNTGRWLWRSRTRRFKRWEGSTKRW